jgi:FkbH-like protein
MNSMVRPLPPLADILEFNNSKTELQLDSTLSFHIYRNFTFEGVEPFLTYQCLLQGIHPTIHFGGYDTIFQDVLELSVSSSIKPPDVIILSIILEQLDFSYGQPEWRSESAQARLLELFQAAADNTTSAVIVNTFIPPYDTDYGIASGFELIERIAEVGAINQVIREFVLRNNTRFFLVDCERLARIFGEQETMDYRFWYMSRAPFKPLFLNQYALEIVKVANALKGKAKKCLVLDCDNTLWGGVVGEDQLHGIKLDRHSYPGNLFYNFQLQVLRLYRRGVIIALVSKNNENDVWEVLDHHSSCLLKREHIAAYRINWDDKASNIRGIAADLNLNLDSFVFVDDSPTECELVRTILPDVTVVQVPSKLYLLPGVLARVGFFDTLVISDEDRQRSNLYRTEVERKKTEAKMSSVDEYLASLGLVAEIRRANPLDFGRVAQLTQKTNQFNLTTRRYSAAQIANFSSNENTAVFSLCARDRFGEYGLTGVFIAFRDGNIGRIDSFLLSCRILGRSLEVVFFNRCLDQLCDSWNISEWFAQYIPSNKNEQTAGFFAKFGFSVFSVEKDNVTYHCNSNQRIISPIPYITLKEDADGNLS